ncbi:MAG: hypothetical protein FWE37_02355 [Spirochaetaceae bacterium]|nr:hypothetical protein [Spirochaetaceae bacterium]
MKIKGLYLILFIGLLSCRSMGEVTPDYFVGTWERVGDVAAGDVVDINIFSETEIEAVMIRVSETSAHFGFVIGDIKWRLVRRINAREFEIDNLNATMVTHADGRITDRRKFFVRFHLIVVNRNLIELTALDEEENRVGNRQQWVRIN